MDFYLAVLLASALASLAIYAKAMTADGVAAAWIMCVIITSLGGPASFAILAATFILTVASDKLAGKRADPEGIRRKSGARDSYRILCNVGFPALAIIIYGITGEERFLLVYAAVMAESLSDSLASKLGPLSKGKTVDICTFRDISPGLSGGVSGAGSAAAFAGAIVIGGISTVFRASGFKYGLLAAILGFSGCLFDSILGSLAQVKYVCPVCGMVTERERHCGNNTVVCKGFKPISNDAVNLLSNLFVFLLSMLVF